MQTGAITEYIDVAQLVLYAFWIFFAGLIYYLHQENKREGYPLESNVPGRRPIQGFPGVPAPKTFHLQDGSSITVPRPGEVGLPPNAALTGGYPGAPLQPIDASTRIGVGPGAYAQRRDIPDVTVDGAPRIVPLRATPDFAIDPSDTDPRGLPVVGADGVVGGVVRDVWVDRSEVIFRYLEIEVAGGVAARGGAAMAATPAAVAIVTTPDSITVATATVVDVAGARGAAGARGTVLVPMNFARVGTRSVVVDSVVGADFAGVPQTRQAEIITFLEEERVMAYYGAGTLYATPMRAEPLL